MPEPDLAQMLAAAAALVLQPPESKTLAALAESDAISVDLERARQDFYDVLCVPLSGRYIPPYAHVLKQGETKDDGQWWYFPPPRFDGGDGLAPWYESVDFDPQRLEADVMLRGPHRPLDNVGYILAYVAGLVASAGRASADHDDTEAAIAAFVVEHLGPWVDRFCELLAGSDSAYLEAVAGAVSEAIVALRERYPAQPAQDADERSGRAPFSPSTEVMP